MGYGPEKLVPRGNNFRSPFVDSRKYLPCALLRNPSYQNMRYVIILLVIKAQSHQGKTVALVVDLQLATKKELQPL